MNRVFLSCLALVVSNFAFAGRIEDVEAEITEIRTSILSLEQQSGPAEVISALRAEVRRLMTEWKTLKNARATGLDSTPPPQPIPAAAKLVSPSVSQNQPQESAPPSGSGLLSQLNALVEKISKLRGDILLLEMTGGSAQEISALRDLMKIERRKWIVLENERIKLNNSAATRPVSQTAPVVAKNVSSALPQSSNQSPDQGKDTELEAALDAPLASAALDERVSPDHESSIMLGFVNIGASCFMNSVLNSIFMVPGFTESLRLNPGELSKRVVALGTERQRVIDAFSIGKSIDPKGYIHQIEEFVQLMKKYLYHMRTGKEANPSHPDFEAQSYFVKDGKVKKHFGREQMDASEFMEFLLPLVAGPNKGFYTYEKQTFGSGLVRDNRSEDTQRLVLRMPIVQGQSKFSDSVKKYFSAQVITDYKNEQTQKPENCSRLTYLGVDRLEETPHELWIFPNRFDYRNGVSVKLDDKLEFDDIGLTFHDPSGGTKTSKFRLIGTIQHRGSLESGHYYAIDLRAPGYTLLSDQSVTPRLLDKVDKKVLDDEIGKRAYGLLYSDR